MEIKINKKTLHIILIVSGILLGILGLQFLLTSGKDSSNNCEGSSCSNVQVSDNVEKVQVVHFHATQQCWTCITVGKYAKKTVTDSFPEEYKNGKIEFLDINIELSENNEITKRFGASGSSLYINVIRDGKDNISEDVKVWQLVSDEQTYISYLENKLKGYLQ